MKETEYVCHKPTFKGEFLRSIQASNEKIMNRRIIALTATCHPFCARHLHFIYSVSCENFLASFEFVSLFSNTALLHPAIRNDNRAGAFQRPHVSGEPTLLTF